jgi:hypothetical protein
MKIISHFRLLMAGGAALLLFSACAAPGDGSVVGAAPDVLAHAAIDLVFCGRTLGHVDFPRLIKSL